MSHQKKKLKLEVIQELQEMVRALNPYINSFKLALDLWERSPELKIILSAQKKKIPVTTHPGCFNLPSGSEVAVLLPGDQAGNLDVLLQKIGGGTKSINSLHRSYDPLHYVLLLPYGQDMFHLEIKNSEQKPVSIRQFYAFHLQVLPNNNVHFIK
jgi:hypothetical protein